MKIIPQIVLSISAS